jgi:hypothetical protein
MDSDNREMYLDYMHSCTAYVLPNSEKCYLITQAELNEAELLGYTYKAGIFQNKTKSALLHRTVEKNLKVSFP